MPLTRNVSLLQRRLKVTEASPDYHPYARVTVLTGKPFSILQWLSWTNDQIAESLLAVTVTFFREPFIAHDF